MQQDKPVIPPVSTTRFATKPSGDAAGPPKKKALLPPGYKPADPKENPSEPSSQPPRKKPPLSEGLDIQVGPDKFFKSDKVMSLNIFNFDKFIKKNEKTLILFFDSLKNESVYPSREFANAANQSQNSKHAFAAVNCSVDTDLCSREQIARLPMMKLFSNGFKVSTIEYLEGFDASSMNKLLTVSPVLTQPRMEVKK